MTIKKLLQQAREFLGPQADMLANEVLLSFVLGKGREYLITHPEQILDESIVQKFCSMLERFKKGEPVAYLINSKEFYGLDFYVDRRALIPRPETELLVEKVLEFVRKFPEKSWNILDIGTGSGCIAVTLAKQLPLANIKASEVSEEALEIAKMNATKHGVSKQITFLQSDLLQNVEGNFDVIVANLPYIGTKRFNLVSKEVYDYEPHVALFGGEDGLSLYEQLFQQILAKKMEPALLLGEFGFLQGEEIRRLHHAYFPGIPLEIFADYANIERVFSSVRETADFYPPKPFRVVTNKI